MRDILLSRDNLLSLTKGKAPFRSDVSPTIRSAQCDSKCYDSGIDTKIEQLDYFNANSVFNSDTDY
jgi:hypothetical protein